MLVVLLAMTLAPPVAAQIPCRYEVIATIQGPNCFGTPVGLIPNAISPNGQYVTGWFGQCGVGNEAFVWTGPPPGTLFKIPRPQGVAEATGVDVNDNGVVTGYCRRNNATNGFVYKKQTGQWIDLLPTQPNGELQPYAINNAGTVVGYRSIRNDVVPREAFIWNEASGFQGLGVMNGPSSGATAISENGIVVGWTGPSQGHPNWNVRAFVRYPDGSNVILDAVPGGTSSYARAVDDLGRVAIEGKIQSSPIAYSNFILANATLSQVNPPAGYNAVGIYQLSNDGFIAGSCGNVGANDSRSAIWLQHWSIVLSSAVTPIGIIDFSSTNTVIGRASTGTLLIFGRTFQNLSVGFVLLPASPVNGDANCDQAVNIDDLLAVIGSWGKCQGCTTDWDHNAIVDIDDLLTVITQWGS